MDTDLPSLFLEELASPLVIFCIVSLASIWAILIWWRNRELWSHLGSFYILVQAWARSLMDTALVAGVLLTSIGIQFMVAEQDVDQVSLEEIFSSFRTAILTFVWGGFMTGLGYCIYRPSPEIKLNIKPGQLLLALGFIGWLIISVLFSTGDPFTILENTPVTLTLYLLLFGTIYITGFLSKAMSFGHKWAFIINCNLVATLSGTSLLMALWFLEGGDFLASASRIHLCANLLFLGCLFYILIYGFALVSGWEKTHDYQTKSWHITEAAAFFIFLVFAPVGLTEYKRESKDQANQEANNESQQLEIDQLKAQIKLLTEKVGEV